MQIKSSRALWLLGLVVLLIAVALGGLRLASRQLQSRIVEALGPRASVGAVELGWTQVELHDLRIASASGWPAEDELRAGRVQVRPDLRSLWSAVSKGPWRIASIRVQDGYLSMLRTREGQLRLLPALLEMPGKPKAAPAPDASPAASADTSRPNLVIGEVFLDDASVDFFDASLKGLTTPHRLQLEQLEVSAGPLTLPALDKAVALDLAGTLKGVQRDGHISLHGEFTPSTRDAKMAANFTGIDLVVLQPYLLKLSETGIKRGQLDLKIDATVAKMQLHAPGAVTLTGLELNSGGGVLSTFAGVPRQAVLAAMSHEGRINIKFTIDGKLDDPAFSLNENLATRIASGLAESLGVSVKGVVEGMGNLVKGLFGH